MAELVRVCEGVYEVTGELALGPGFGLPVRSTTLVLDDGSLAVVSPLRFDDAVAKQLDALGPVKHLVAPNLLHHLFVGDARARWPEARVHGAPGLAKKRADLRFDAVLGADPRALGPAVELVPVEGAEKLAEVALFHRPSRTLVLTDLAFNVTEPRGWLTPWVLRMVGAHRRFAQSRALRFMVRDRAAAAASAQRLLALEPARVVVAHGAVVEADATRALEGALAWMLAGAGPRAALASGAG